LLFHKEAIENLKKNRVYGIPQRLFNVGQLCEEIAGHTAKAVDEGRLRTTYAGIFFLENLNYSYTNSVKNVNTVKYS
jgi:hypothetical protein